MNKELSNNFALLIGALISLPFVQIIIEFSNNTYGLIKWLLPRVGILLGDNLLITNIIQLVIGFLFLLPAIHYRESFRKIGSLPFTKTVFLMFLLVFSFLLFGSFMFGCVVYLINVFSRLS